MSSGLQTIEDPYEAGKRAKAKEPPDAPHGALDDYLTGQGSTWTDRGKQALADAQVAAFRAGYKIGWTQAVERLGLGRH